MAHDNVKRWADAGMPPPRPCDWCGCPLQPHHKFIHTEKCLHCLRKCYDEESLFYTQLGYDGESDVKLPPGYNIVIPR